MSAFTYESRFGTRDDSIFKPLNVTQWNKAFSNLCGSCSMLVLELLSDTSNPTVNYFQYKPKQSPAYNDLLYQQYALGFLKKTLPTPLVEKYFECTQTAVAAYTSAVGSASALAQLVSSSFTNIITILLLYYIVCFNVY